MMRPSTSRGCLAEEPARAGRQSARWRVHHAWGTAPKPTKERVAQRTGWGNRKPRADASLEFSDNL